MTGSENAHERASFIMSLEEARIIIKKLARYKGRIMQPFTSPVNDFLVLPSGRQQLLNMLDAMTAHDQPFDKAIAPYKDSVVILVCPAVRGADDALNHCSLGSFLDLNDIDPSEVLAEVQLAERKRA